MDYLHLLFLNLAKLKNDKIIKSQPAENTRVSLEFTFRDSSHITFSDGINNEIDQRPNISDYILLLNTIFE